MGIELHDPGNTPPSTFISDVAAQQDPTDIESIEDDSLLIMSTAIDADTQNHAPRHRALSNHHVLSANSLPIPDLWPDWYFENPETYREQEERLAAEAAEQNDDLSTDDE